MEKCNVITCESADKSYGATIQMKLFRQPFARYHLFSVFCKIKIGIFMVYYGVFFFILQMIPLIVEHCCEVVERKGLESVGVYR